MAKQQIGAPTINAAVAALRFFFNVTLERPDLVRHLTTVARALWRGETFRELFRGWIAETRKLLAFHRPYERRRDVELTMEEGECEAYSLADVGPSATNL